MEATVDISVDKYASLSIVIPWYNEILDHLEAVKVFYFLIFCDLFRDLENPLSDRYDSLDWDTKDDLLHACNHSYEKLLGYFDISSDYCTIAILLDPRFKLDFYVDDTKTSTEISNQQNEAWIQLRRVLDAYYPVSESTSAPEPCSFSGVNRIFKN